jgi:predicted metal-dependent hydrolase
MRNFAFGSFTYEYALLREQRKTLSLTVMPDLRLVVKCPHGASEERIEAFLRRKWLWLEEQLGFFKKYQRKKYVREYVSGESYLYLGKQYKLMVQRSSVDRVILSRGVLQVYTIRTVSDTIHTKRLINAWYVEKTRNYFNERFEESLKTFDYETEPKLFIREMPKRWGSFVGNKRIILNPKLIYAARECIDYVIIHELCHVRYKDHGKEFFSFLGKKYPGWRKIKDKLELYAI